MDRLFKTVLISLFFVSALLSPLSAAGQGNDKLEQAQSDFAALDFEGALEKLDQARATMGNSRDTLVRIFSLKGRCLVALGREEEAESAFLAALSIEPTFRLGSDVSPRYRDPFERVLKRGVDALSVGVDIPDRLEFGKPVPVMVRLEEDPARIAHKLVLRHRRAGQARYSTMRIKLKQGKQVRFYLPPGVWSVEGEEPLEWYAEVHDRYGGRLLLKGDAVNPMRIAVTHPEPEDDKLTAGGAPLAPAAAPEASPAWYERWWVWAIIGGTAIAVGGTAAALTLTRDTPGHRDFNLEID